MSNIDDVLNYHSDFLNNCLKDCMLTNPELLRIVHKLMMVCVTFSNFMQVSHSYIPRRTYVPTATITDRMISNDALYKLCNTVPLSTKVAQQQRWFMFAHVLRMPDVTLPLNESWSLLSKASQPITHAQDATTQTD